MKVRKLQQLNDDQVWVDDAYAYEDDQEGVEFRYNTLTWGRVGASLNRKIQKENISLEDIETIIPPDEEVRWLPIEIISDEEINDVIAALDETCKLPKPRPILIEKVLTA